MFIFTFYMEDFYHRPCKHFFFPLNSSTPFFVFVSFPKMLLNSNSLASHD